MSALPCPPWCDRRHIPAWTVHVADCGDVVVGETVFSVEVARYADDRPPVLNVSTHTDHESVSHDLAPEHARQLLGALARGLTLLATEEAADRALSRHLDERDGTR